MSGRVKGFLMQPFQERLMDSPSICAIGDSARDLLRSMTQTASASERRKSPRVWLRRPGQLTVVKGLRGTTTIPCKVINTSKGGALLQVEGAAADIPDDFYLAISGQSDRPYVCAVVRRGKRLLAVRFIAQPQYEVRISTSYSS
jgi:hypothetical protein